MDRVTPGKQSLPAPFISQRDLGGLVAGRLGAADGAPRATDRNGVSPGKPGELAAWGGDGGQVPAPKQHPSEGGQAGLATDPRVQTCLALTL